MSTEQMRQEFEKAYLLVVNEGEKIEITEEDMRNSRRGDEYTGTIASAAWWAWQASRAAVLIDLPDYCNCCYEPSEVAENFLDAIKAAGLQVKP